MQVGCERYELEEWWSFDDKKILSMSGREALKWWRKWKPVLQQIIDLSPAEPTKQAEQTKDDCLDPR